MSSPACYCGERGEDTLSMLECIKCGRWCHEDCIRCLNLPMLLGDRFYIFICALCNKGSESLSRIELRWLDIAHLLLFHLTMKEKKKYFHIETLVPFLRNNWERFHVFGPIAAQKNHIRSKLQQNLESCQVRFKCGKEVKKSKDIWALRERAPPEPPKIQENGLDFRIKGRTYHVITAKKSPKAKEPLRNGKLKHNSTAKLSNTATQLRSEVSKCRGSVSHPENGIHRTKSKTKRITTAFDEDCAQFGLLDSIIPSSAPDNVHNLFGFVPENAHWRPLSVEKPLKRKRTSVDQIFTNGDHQFSDDNSSILPFLTMKETNSYSSNVDFCVIGKRTTPSGKVQYLFQRNRAKMERAVAEKKPFQVTYLCKCRDCKRLNEPSIQLL